MKNKLKLSEIGKFIRGVSFQKELGRSERAENHILLLRSNNITEELNFDKSLYIPADKVKKEQIIKPNDIMICMNSGSKHLVGKAVQIRNRIESPLTFGSFCGIFRCHENINQQYVGFFFRSEAYKKEIQNSLSGVLINNLNPTNITDVEIPLPSMETQQKIVSILEEIDNLRQKQRKAIELTRQMIPALFYEMFGDIETNEKGFDKIKLQDVTTINPKDKVNLKDSDEVTFVPMSAINAENGTILIPEVKLVIEAKRKGFSCFKEGDVLFAKITPCMQNKKSAIAKHLLNGLGYGSTEFHVLRPSSLILAEYLLRILRSSKFIEIAKKHFTGTAGQQRVPKDFIANFTISLPPIELQKRYADKVQEIRSLLEHQEQSIQKLDVLFETTLNQFFS